MAREVTEALAPIPAGVLLDATLGAGGHTAALLERRPDLSFVGLDRDPSALAAAARLLPSGVQMRQCRFADLGAVLAELGIEELAGVLFDLGVSSMQLDDPDRGFSYRAAGPIDMRMDPAAAPSASAIVNEWPAERLASLLREFGDETHSRRIARAIVARRPLGDTVELAEVVRAAIPARNRRHGGHPAKRSFQALRIAVNDELAQIPPALTQAIDRLAPAGRGVVLSYHSGEDRLVKDTLADAAVGGCACSPRLPCVCGAVGRIRLLTRGATRPGPAETSRNPRAASARLRAFEKLAQPAA
ncbi:MAG: 16S rRNA (cytosine(1402)-N(4))-methyltransferase RsmH [Acidimicrobiia bacterium]|nr:16S rRNA (cytosine(1402)-N(4))-methyltransferase RsmH [Acidimicrobiia bacterium]MYE67781.1 16S rRNA (cytosine(1402)-N(4))-methyltransferase RsmH [Acidimicrobiia bacterium]MYJ14244.1 16S rRNA (cytosine(1402)-N(4))-methyltransferase RsmH [Acidimicrobiia bacterium]